MFTKQELQNLYVVLHERAMFQMSGKEADEFVKIKGRVAEEYNKLTQPQNEEKKKKS